MLQSIKQEKASILWRTVVREFGENLYEKTAREPAMQSVF